MILKRDRLAPILTTFLLAASVQAGHAQDPPDGAGKDLVMNVCTQCHTSARIVAKKATKDEWNAVVDNMAMRGAKATDEEFDAIVAYLAKNFGPDQAQKSN